MSNCLDKIMNFFGIKPAEPTPQPEPIIPAPEPTPEPIPEPEFPEPPQPSVRNKYALIVGVGKYADPEIPELNGPPNDVNSMYNLLVNYFRFEPDNIRVLLDERATKSNIMERLDWLVSDRNEGDTLIYYHSGHGSQVRDRNGDELTDGLDEILIPYDHDWDSPLSDDILADIFTTNHEAGDLTVICDTCHSGTVTKAFTSETVDQIIESGFTKQKRSVTPPTDIELRSVNRALETNYFGRQNKGDEGHVLLSGCKENQTSVDAYYSTGWSGALTYFLIHYASQYPKSSWSTLHRLIFDSLKKYEYDQEPQLTGEESLKDKPIFGGV